MRVWNVKNVCFLEFKVRLPNGKSETRRVECGRQGQLLAFFEKAFSVKFKDHALGQQLDAVEGQRSSFYHFALVDKMTGKKYLPYAEGNDGKKIYLDLRHIIATKEFAQNMAVEVFLAYDHREPEGTLTTRYDGMHAAFQLDEFTSADLRMADIERMMRKHYIGNAGEDFRFHFLQLRARMLADSPGRRQAVPSPVFSLDGTAFSFSLPAGEMREDDVAPAPERSPGAPEPVMLLESQPWFGPVAGDCVARQSVPSPLAHMPILAESLAIVEFPMMNAKNAKAGRDVRAQKIDAQAESRIVMRAAGKIASENSFEAIRAERKEECKKNGKEEGPGCNSGLSEGRGRGAKRKVHAKPVPFSALSSFKAVIFDLDGVIVDSEMVHPRTFERALEKYGIRIDNAHWKRAYTGIGSYAIFDDLVKKYKINEDARELVKKRNEIYMEEIQRNRLPVISGFHEVHRMLVENGVKESVASGGHINHVEESMRSAGLKNMPFVAIEQVKRGKPAPEIFLKAARRLRVKPSECIVFEDSLSGVEAAARAGMPCIALTTTMTARQLRGKAALIVRNYKSKKLRKLLAVLLAGRKRGAQAKTGKKNARLRIPGKNMGR